MTDRRCVELLFQRLGDMKGTVNLTKRIMDSTMLVLTGYWVGEFRVDWWKEVKFMVEEK